MGTHHSGPGHGLTGRVIFATVSCLVSGERDETSQALSDGPAPALVGASARLREVALLFTRLGFTAFGGPAAHVAMMEDEVVRRRGWIDREHFLDLVAAINFVPGPNSTELAIHLGLIRAGRLGLVVAGACFILPAMLIILPLAWLYVRYGHVPQVQDLLRGISAAIVAIIAVVLYRFGQTALKDRFTVAIAIGVAAVGYVAQNYPQWQPELVLLAIAAILGAVWYNRAKLRGMASLCVVLPVGLTTTATMPSAGTLPLSDLLRMGLFFLKVGATLYGSGYVLVSYLESGLVEQHGWLTRQELLDAVAVGQVTPGPLLTTATFVGYVLGHTTFGGGTTGGIVGGVLATSAIFLPSFLFVFILGTFMSRIRRNPWARGALDAVNATVVALILLVLIELAVAALRDPLSIGIAIVALVALLVWNINSTWLVVGAALVGMGARLVN